CNLHHFSSSILLLRGPSLVHRDWQFLCEAVCDKTVDHVADSHHDHASENGVLAGSENGINAVEHCHDRHHCVSPILSLAHVGVLHHHHQAGQGEDVRHHVGYDSQVHQNVELIVEAGRHCGQRHS